MISFIISFFNPWNITDNKNKVLEKELSTSIVASPKDSTKTFMEGLSFEKFENDSFKFSEFKDKVILIHYWATWCAPCIKQHQHVETLFQHINNSDFKIITISIDSNKKNWIKFLKKNKWNSTNLYLGNNHKNPLISLITERTEHEDGSSSIKTLIPQYYLIDKNNTIIEINNIKSKKTKNLIKKKLAEK